MAVKGYLHEAYEHAQSRWSQMMAAEASRRFVIKAGTLAALGGASAMAQLMAACAAGGTRENAATTELAEGSFKYSRFPLAERYNWRLAKWDMTPYYGGTLLNVGGAGPANSYDLVRVTGATIGGRFWQNLYRLHVGPRAETAGWSVVPDDAEGTDGPVRIEPAAAAEMPKIAPDFSYYEVKIRPDIYFHYNPGADTTPEVKAMIEKIGGRNVTADDVKFVFDAFRNPKTSLLYENLEFLDRIEVTDKYTLRFHMVRPVMFFTQVIATSFYWIFPPEQTENKQVWQAWPIGTGPFMVQYSKTGDRMEGVRHPKFTEVDRGGFRQPYADKFIGRVLADQAVTKAAYRSGQLDYFAPQSLDELNDIIATNPESTVAVVPQTAAVQTQYNINWKNPTWGDGEAGLKMRRALSMSIDRRALNDLILGGAGVPAGPIPYGAMGLKQPIFWDEMGPYQQYNPAEAKRLMAEAGYANGYDLEILFATGSSSVGFTESTVVATQQQMAASGFRLTPITQESVVVTTAQNDKKFKDLTITNISSGNYDMEMTISRLWGDPNYPRNYGSVDDPVLRDIAEKQRYELNWDRRTQLARQAHERYVDIIPQLFIIAPHRLTVTPPWIHNIGDSTFSWAASTSSQQVRQVFLDDTAPDGRGGKRGKDGTWGVPFDRQGRRV